MDVLDCIKGRRSIRSFSDKPISKETILKILDLGRWAPSGVNYQPWKVKVVVNEDMKKSLAQCSKYGKIITNASHNLVIYLDTSQGYEYTKNVQSIGAFCQTLLLAAHACSIGAVWLGEPYNQKEKIDLVFENKDPNLKFMAIIALGYPAQLGKSARKAVKSFTTWFE